MKLQINLRNGQYITTECTQNEYDVFVKSFKDSIYFHLVTVPGAKFDMVAVADIISLIEIKQPLPCGSI